jgi:uncharacterized protein (TIGR03437 family)
MPRFLFAVPAVLWLSLFNANAASSYSAVNDFSIGANPNGAWSYLASNALLSVPIVGTGTLAGLDYWGNGGGLSNGDWVFANVSGKVINTQAVNFPTDHLDLSPNVGNVSVRFTSPSGGLYTVVGDFLGDEAGQTQTHNVAILVNGSSIFSGTIVSAGQSLPFNQTLTLKAGDALDFVNYSGATVNYDNTALAVTITPVSATPAITSTGVVSAGAFGGFPSAAPGSWIEIYGANLAPDTRSWSTADFTGANAPTALDGVTVSIGGKSCFIDYISPGQVNVLIPSDAPTGTQALTVTSPLGVSPPYMIAINPVQPGLLAPSSFTVAGTPFVVALFQDGTYALAPGAVAGVSSHLAKPGDVLTLYGVGFGAVIPASQRGNSCSSLTPSLLPSKSQ